MTTPTTQIAAPTRAHAKGSCAATARSRFPKRR